MFAFLSVAGVVVTLAGLALVATGAIPHDGAIDSGTLTAGTIAAVGGLLLIGIGLTVRELRRIEQVIASGRRPPRRPCRRRSSHRRCRGAQSAARAIAGEAGAHHHTSRYLRGGCARARRHHIRTSANKNSGPRPKRRGPAFAEGDAAPVSRLPLRSEDFRERRDTAAKAYAGNGATPPRSITDFETRPRLAGSPATPKAKVFNAFWSEGSGRGRQRPQLRRQLRWRGRCLLAPRRRPVSLIPMQWRCQAINHPL